MSPLKHAELTNKAIKAFYTVYNKLGHGFLEKVYENAIQAELRMRNIQALTQIPIQVYYRKMVVGKYFADLILDNKVIVEIKAREALHEEHELQLINYLKATDKEVGLLLNFGTEPQFKRKIMDKEFK